jgi:hypothetical protein
MKFRPLHDRVVIKRIEAEEKTSGGIITRPIMISLSAIGDLLAPSHSITSSARTSTVAGTSRPSARDAEKRPASGMGGAQTKGLARTYERPALRKPFAAFPADSKVA